MNSNVPNYLEHLSTLVGVSEVAQKLSISDQTVRNWIKAGTVYAIRAGKQYRIPSSELERLILEGGGGTAA